MTWRGVSFQTAICQLVGGKKAEIIDYYTNKVKMDTKLGETAKYESVGGG